MNYRHCADDIICSILNGDQLILVRPTELCGKVLSAKKGYKSVKTAVL